MILLPYLLAFLTGPTDQFDSVAKIAFAPNGHTFAVGGLHGVTVFDATNAKISIHLEAGKPGQSQYNRIVFSGDSQRVAEDYDARPTADTYENDVLIWDIPTAKLVGTVHATSNVAMSLSRDGSQLAWCPGFSYMLEGEDYVRLNDVRSGKLISQRHIRASDVKFSPAGDYLASACADGSVRLFDPLTFKERGHLQSAAFSLFSIDFSPSGKRLVAGGARAGSDKKAGFSVTDVWDLSTKKIVWSAPPEPYRLTMRVQFIGETVISRLSSLLGFMGDGGDPQMREERFALVGGERKPGLAMVRYSGDGRYAAGLSDNEHTLVIHDLTTNKIRKIRLNP